MKIVGVESTQTPLKDVAVGRPFIYQSVLFIRIVGNGTNANAVNLASGIITYFIPETLVGVVDAHIRYGKE